MGLTISTPFIKHRTLFDYYHYLQGEQFAIFNVARQLSSSILGIFSQNESSRQPVPRSRNPHNPHPRIHPQSRDPNQRHHSRSNLIPSPRRDHHPQKCDRDVPPGYSQCNSIQRSTRDSSRSQPPLQLWKGDTKHGPSSTSNTGIDVQRRMV